MAKIQTLSGEWFEPDLPGRLLKIAGDIREAGGRAFLVGGWVRDALLGKSCRDYDVEVYDMAQDALVPILDAAAFWADEGASHIFWATAS